ncbi:hypothetical protein JG688_00001914, partial [Phytophthora aleatoria]
MTRGEKVLSGGSPGRGPGFGGGQTPLYQRVPKRSFNSKFATPMKAVNLDKLQLFHGIKLLGNGSQHLTAKMDIEVSQVSESAFKAVEAAGASITSVYHNRLALRALRKR